MTQDEILQLQMLLGKCQPGKLPIEVFTGIARLTVLPAVEFIPLGWGKSGVEVLLISRPADDPVWPNMLHTPGTILRPTDDSFESAFRRLAEDELGISNVPEMIRSGFGFTHGERGSGVTFEYIVTLNGPPKFGNYYPYSNLPLSFISEQKAMLARAVEKFKSISEQLGSSKRLQ